MRAFLTIWRREWQDAVASAVGWRVSMWHLGLVALAALLGWPAAYTLGQAAWAPALAWWAYAEVLILSYLALAVPADTLAAPDAIRPGQWIYYGNASPWGVLCGQTAATMSAVLFWLLTAAPVLLLCLLLRPLPPDRLLTLLLFLTLLIFSLSQLGAWIGVAIESRPYRILAVDLAYLVVMLGSLIVRSAASARIAAYLGASLLGMLLKPLAWLAGRLIEGWQAAPLQNGPLLIVQPLDVTSTILNVSPRDVLAASAPGNIIGIAPTSPQATAAPGLMWNQIVFVYGGLALVAAALALAILKQWQRRYAHTTQAGQDSTQVKRA